MAWTEKYVSVAGGGAHNGSSEANAWTLAEAIAAVAAGARVNIIAGTYANTTTDRTFATAGTVSAPIWWRGYNTTIGDIETDNTLTKPAITFTTGRFLVTGAYQIFSHLSISGAHTTAGSGQARCNASVLFYRCRIECTSANANGSAFYLDSSTTKSMIVDCSLKANASATQVISNASGNDILISGCSITGGGNGITLASTGSSIIKSCVFNNNGGDGIRITNTGRAFISECSIYSAGSDGIEITVSTTITGIIANCIISESAGWGINQSSGTATAGNIHRFGNLFYSNSSGNETGFGDGPSFREQTDSASPFMDAANGNFSLRPSSNGRIKGVPGLFENQSYTNYLDIGAVQRREGGRATMLMMGI